MAAQSYRDKPWLAYMNIDGDLNLSEVRWRNMQPWLVERGYQLRPRFRPGWVPSWEGASKGRVSCEDGQMASYPIIDATRISDGKVVCLKHTRIESHPQEAAITGFLGSPELLEDPKNHCIPLYEVLDVPLANEDPAQLLVLPLLRPWDDPPLLTVGEAVDFFHQILEGMSFVHDRAVAHRDPTYQNWMLDPTSMYPNLYHPAEIDKNYNFKGKAKYYTRTERPPRYVLIDFGLSRRFDPESLPVLDDAPVMAGDKSAPEIFEKNGKMRKVVQPFDPFPTDVYYTGNLIRRDLIEIYTGLDFLSPLIADMVQDDPTERPTIREAMDRFEKLIATLSKSKLRSRICKREELGIVSLFRYIPHVVRTIKYIVKGIPPIPKAQPSSSP